MEPIILATGAKVLGAAGEIAAKEAESFLSKIFGDVGTALGGLFADKINARRHRNLIPMVAAAKRQLQEAGLEPQAVPLKIIHPLLESASLEEEPELQTLWANLLFNAADPRQTTPVNPIFVLILKSLTASEARFLQAFYMDRTDVRHSRKKPQLLDPLQIGVSKEELLIIAQGCGAIPLLPTSPRQSSNKEELADYHGRSQERIRALNMMIDSLLRNRIVNEEMVLLPVRIGRDNLDQRLRPKDRDPIDIDTKQQYTLTELGVRFIRACRPQKPIASHA